MSMNTSMDTSMDAGTVAAAADDPDAAAEAQALAAPMQACGEGTAMKAARIIASGRLARLKGFDGLIATMARLEPESAILALQATAASGSVAGGYAVMSLGVYPTAGTPFTRNAKPKIISSMLKKDDIAWQDDAITAADVLSAMVAEPMAQGWNMADMLPEDGPWSWHDTPGDEYLMRTFTGIGGASGHPISSDYVYRRMIALSRTPAEDMQTMGFEDAALLIHLLDFTPESILGYDTWGSLYHAAMRCARQSRTSLESFTDTLSSAVFNWKGTDNMLVADDLERMAGMPFDYIKETVKAEWDSSRMSLLEKHGEFMEKNITALTGSVIGINPHAQKATGRPSAHDGKPAREGRRARTETFLDMFGFFTSFEPRMIANGNLEGLPERHLTRLKTTTVEHAARMMLALPTDMWPLMEHDTHTGDIAGFLMDHPLETAYDRLDSSGSSREDAKEPIASRALAWAQEILEYGEDAAYRWMAWTRIQKEIRFLLYDCEGLRRLGVSAPDAASQVSAAPVSDVRMWVRDGTVPDHLIIPLKVSGSYGSMFGGIGRSGARRNRWIAIRFDDPRFGILMPKGLARFIPDGMRMRVDIPGILNDLPKTWAGFRSLIRDGEDADDAYRRIMLRHVSPVAAADRF